MSKTNSSESALSDLLCLSTDKVKEYKRNGWIFTYCPSTKFVGAEHPKGGKQSVCEVRNKFDNDSFGYFISDSLNAVEG